MTDLKQGPKPSCRFLGVLLMAAATAGLAGIAALIGVLT